MDKRNECSVRRIAAALLLASGLGGCVYAPPYAAYDPYYPTYSYPSYSYPAFGYPAYAGPPISLDFGFGYYHHHRGHGYDGAHGRRGWGHGGWRH